MSGIAERLFIYLSGKIFVFRVQLQISKFYDAHLQVNLQYEECLHTCNDKCLGVGHKIEFKVLFKIHVNTLSLMKEKIPLRI
jgi:hypothetical protein